MNWFIGYMLIAGLVMAMLASRKDGDIPDRPVYLWTAMLWPVWMGILLVAGITWLVGVLVKEIL